MEMNNIDQQQSSPFSWWWDSHNRPPQSQWLHSTLTELDEQIKTILDLIEDNGDTFAERAEMYYKKRPELIKMVQELHRSYRALADKHDQLKSESSIKASNNGSVSNSSRKLHPFQDCAKGKPKPHTNASVVAPNLNSEEISAADSKSVASSFECHSSKSFASFGASDKLVNERESECRENRKKCSSAGEENGLMMKFSKLFDENLSKQSELIRRNEEKREVISGLRNENRILSRKSSDETGNKGREQSQKRKLRGFFCLG